MIGVLMTAHQEWMRLRALRRAQRCAAVPQVRVGIDLHGWRPQGRPHDGQLIPQTGLQHPQAEHPLLLVGERAHLGRRWRESCRKPCSLGASPSAFVASRDSQGTY